MAQEKVQAQKQARKTEQEQSNDQDQKQQNSLSDEVDEMLEEIDGVLEENAEAFIKEYVQKGGQLFLLGRFNSAFISAGPISADISPVISLIR